MGFGLSHRARFVVRNVASVAGARIGLHVLPRRIAIVAIALRQVRAATRPGRSRSPRSRRRRSRRQRRRWRVPSAGRRADRLQWRRRRHLRPDRAEVAAAAAVRKHRELAERKHRRPAVRRGRRHRRQSPPRHRSADPPSAVDNNTGRRRHPTTSRHVHCGFRDASVRPPRRGGRDKGVRRNYAPAWRRGQGAHPAARDGHPAALGRQPAPVDAPGPAWTLEPGLPGVVWPPEPLPGSPAFARAPRHAPKALTVPGRKPTERSAWRLSWTG